MTLHSHHLILSVRPPPNQHHVIFRGGQTGPHVSECFCHCETFNIHVFHSVPLPQWTPTKMMNPSPPLGKDSCSVVTQQSNCSRTVGRCFLRASIKAVIVLSLVFTYRRVDVYLRYFLCCFPPLFSLKCCLLCWSPLFFT